MGKAKPSGDIVYVRVGLLGELTSVMIDTGTNISLIDKTELNRIQESNTEKIPTPVSYTHLDVYKRQTNMNTEPSSPRSMEINSVKRAMAKLME